MLYFAASTVGFYDTRIQMPEQIPADAVEITQETLNELMYAQAMQGKQIVADGNGYPIAVDPPADPAAAPSEPTS